VRSRRRQIPHDRAWPSSIQRIRLSHRRLTTQVHIIGGGLAGSEAAFKPRDRTQWDGAKANDPPALIAAPTASRRNTLPPFQSPSCLKTDIWPRLLLKNSMELVVSNGVTNLGPV